MAFAHFISFHFDFRHEKENQYAPAPDVLHSGLTNDMYSLANKRTIRDEFSSETGKLIEYVTKVKTYLIHFFCNRFPESF